MTKQEHTRLINYLEQHNGKPVDFYGWFHLYEEYAKKQGIPQTHDVDNLSPTKSALVKFPAKHILKVNLWVSYGRGNPSIYF